MKHACFIAAAVAVALLGFAAPASATHSDGITQCGETIETNNATVLLTSDVVCPDGFFFNGGAIRIDAENVTLNLGGHAIRSGTAGGSVGIFGDRTDGSGIPLPYSNLTIRNGTIEGFIEGVSVLASNSTVAGMRVNPGVYPFANPVGIATRGNDNLLIRNTIVFGELSAGSGTGIFSDGDDVHITRNTVTGSNPQRGIVSGENNPRIAVNRVECDGGPGGLAGIHVYAYTRAVVARNTVTGCSGWGIQVDRAGAEVRRNSANFNNSGILSAESPARLWCNTANGNEVDGIVASNFTQEGVGNLIEENTANNNGRNGIQAAPQATGEGNVATGNGAENCVDIVCREAPPTDCPIPGSAGA